MTASRSTALWGLFGALVLACFAIAAVVLIAFRFRSPAAYCETGFDSIGPACCLPGQHLVEGRCSGKDFTCPPGRYRVDEPVPGCTMDNRLISFDKGQLVLGPMDWEAEGIIKLRTVSLEPFLMDSLEVTYERWQQCVHANSCDKLKGDQAPGLPVTGVTPAMAERFCLFFGGRLPTSDEWIYAAAGAPVRRYPWGNTGLVCRRAVFGLLNGPCGSGAVGPTAVGSRPDGRTPEGLYDMAGNVAEWTREGKGFVARGGSFRSSQAGQLKSWASESAAQAGAHIGFRCAYDPSQD